MNKTRQSLHKCTIELGPMWTQRSFVSNLLNYNDYEWRQIVFDTKSAHANDGLTLRLTIICIVCWRLGEHITNVSYRKGTKKNTTHRMGTCVFFLFCWCGCWCSRITNIKVNEQRKREREKKSERESVCLLISIFPNHWFTISSE